MEALKAMLPSSLLEQQPPTIVLSALVGAVVLLFLVARASRGLGRKLPLACGFAETLREYQPGRILHLHHSYASRTYPRCWTIQASE